MGREFTELFDDWAVTYDETVNSRDNEYYEVFEHYDDILTTVAEKAVGTTLEFGVGTGNLTAKLLRKGHHVYGVEPSQMMREKVRAKFPALPLIDGDFLHFSGVGADDVATIASTYAFHHLTDDEKREAIRKYSKLLPKDGKIVFADTLYENERGRHLIMQRVERQGFNHLLHDLRTEYYTTKDVLKEMFEVNGFQVAFEQLNRYVWLIHAVKISSINRARLNKDEAFSKECRHHVTYDHCKRNDLDGKRTR